MADESPPQDPPPPRSESKLVAWGPVVATLIVANLAMFGVELASGIDPFKPQVQKVIDLGANYAPLTLHGEWWRLFSSMFLHYGIIHIAMNMLCLYQGRIVERLYGSVGFAAIYLVAGLCGSVASLARMSNAASAGASGAVFGVFGAFGAFIWLRRDRMNPEAVHKIARSLGSFVGINFIIGVTTPGIDVSAHIGGLIGGFASGAALLYGKNADRQRVLRVIAVLIAGAAVTVAAVFAIPDKSLDTRYMNTQHATITTYNELLRQRGAGQLDDAQLADRIEHDVLPQWAAIREEIEIATPPGNKTRHYMEVREKSWRALVAALRDPSNQDLALKARQLLEEAKQAAEATNDN
jgi:rhomboid protease GluP